MKDKQKCHTRYCCNQPRKGTTLCHKCYSRRYKETHPFRYCYNTLKQNAKRRGKSFDLTFEQFKAFAIETDYINKKGRHSRSYTIDRIDATKGYSVDNIQAMTNRANIKKRSRVDYVMTANGPVFRSYTVNNVAMKQDVPF